jgi:pre-rRNA-processing protein IPI3
MESSIDINQLTKEVLVSTDMHGEFWNVCVWDYTSGTNLQTFKNSNTNAHGLDFIRNDYMLCAAHNKPFITYWNLKGKVRTLVNI